MDVELVETQVVQSDLSLEMELKLKSFPDSEIDCIAVAILNNLGSRDILVDASNLKLDQGDRLFRYSLSASLLGGLVDLLVDGENAKIRFSSAKSLGDLEVITKIVGSIIEALSARIKGQCNVSWHAHTVFSDQSVGELVLSSWSVPGLVWGGRTGLVNMSQDYEEAHIGVERSMAHDHGVFMAANLRGYLVNRIQESLVSEIVNSFTPFGIVAKYPMGDPL